VPKPSHQPQLGNRPLVGQAALKSLWLGLDEEVRQGVSQAVRLWAKIKRAGGKVVVATGSGPNLHESVTCQVAELVRLGLVDGVLTSAAVAGHEMAGALERVKRVEGARLGLDPAILPADGRVEVSLLGAEAFERLAAQTALDPDHYRALLSAPGPEIVKVAGNLAYPTGLWLERMARSLQKLAKKAGLPLEAVAGLGCDPLTMLGACARQKTPCLVTVPQMVGGGQVGLAIADSISVTERSSRIAALLASADLIIESGVALTQEIHDGPLETYTGHGLWANHEGFQTYSLENKAVVRIDLDPALKLAWRMQRDSQTVAQAIHQGKPKAIGTGLAFRMEMSGFARLPGSLPITADLGAVWPNLSARLCKALGVKPGFLCYKQGTPPGEAVRDYIVEHVLPMDPSMAARALKDLKTWR
jgi:hypothetical protein